MIRRRLSASHSYATSLLYLVQLLHILLGLGMLLLQPLLPHELLVSFEFFSFEEEALLFSHHQNHHVTKNAGITGGSGKRDLFQPSKA